MAEEQEQQDRTEEPTPKRREDARKKGEVPRSRELTMTGVMLTGASALLLLAGPLADVIIVGLRQSLEIERARIFDSGYLPEALATASLHAFKGMLPFVGILMVAVFFAAAALGGWSFSMQAAMPKAERMNPVKGVKRIFSANSLNELMKAMAKFLVVAAFTIAWLWWSVDELLMLGRQPVATGIREALELCGVSLLVVSSGLILIALVDVPFQLWNYRKKLRMTRTEVRDEFKETEGRPEVKSRIRQLQQQVATRRMMEQVPDADVVITNPTHYAVALAYDDSRSGAPRVVAKGRDTIAAKIREIAGAHHVPLFQAPPLARALYRSTKLDAEIPAALYTAVAQVLAYIFQIRSTALPKQEWPAPPVPDVDEGRF